MSFEADIAALEARTPAGNRRGMGMGTGMGTGKEASGGGGPPLSFRRLCEAVFHTVEGQQLLAMLCTVRHPMDHSYCADARLAAHQAGQREVIAALWRCGAARNSVAEVQTDGAERQGL